MVRVAIVDDEQRELDTLLDFFRKLQNELREEIVATPFQTGEALLEGYDYSYDLICLDIELDGRDGVSVAKELRRRDGKVVLMFVTNMAQMAICGYEVRALDFLVKPVSYYSFSMKMRSAVRMIQNRKSRNIVLQMVDGMQKISTDQLYYVEVSGHYIFYHTKGGEFRQKAALKEVEEKLKGLSFERCNNCYLVNLKHVDCVKKDEIYVGGDWLKISRPRRKAFLKSLANYMGGVEEA